jgi:hypothetical protein
VLVPHLPCSFHCEKSLKFAEDFITLGRDVGHQTEIDWAIEVLRWPVEWSTLHGIAEIKTPILKTSANTDATPLKYTARWRGSTYPKERATGVGFPYQAARNSRTTGPPQVPNGYSLRILNDEHQIREPLRSSLCFATRTLVVGNPYPEMRVGTQDDGSFAIANVPWPVRYVCGKIVAAYFLILFALQAILELQTRSSLSDQFFLFRKELFGEHSRSVSQCFALNDEMREVWAQDGPILTQYCLNYRYLNDRLFRLMRNVPRLAEPRTANEAEKWAHVLMSYYDELHQAF